MDEWVKMHKLLGVYEMASGQAPDGQKTSVLFNKRPAPAIEISSLGN